MEIVGEISDIAFGGSGILRNEGFVLFVPHTVPGDIVKIRITQRKKSFAHAELLEIIHPSSQRTEPFCPYFSKCGGCQFQHIHYADQVKYKKKFIEEAISRIGNYPLILDEFIVAEKILGYRRRIRLTLHPQNPHFEAGFIGENHFFLKIEQCPIFHKEEETIIGEIQNLVHLLQNPSNQKGAVTLLKDFEGKYILFFEFEEKTPKNFYEVIQKFAFEGILVKDKKTERHIGKCETQILIEDLSIYFSPQCFIQNHPEQSLKIYQLIKKISEPLLHSTFPKILDLYCGIGITSLMLAKQLEKIDHHIIGIECNPHAISFAKKNAMVNKLATPQFLCKDVNSQLLKILSKFTPDLVLINPPRTGLENCVIENLSQSGIKEMIYISCMPATLARDLKKFIENGYHIVFAAGIDLFPHTSHVETLIHLKHFSSS